MRGKPGTLDQGITAYRLGDPNGEFPIYDDEGSRRYPGRWNTPDAPMIYASANYSTALLEKLVHLSFVLPRAMHYIEISIPAGVSYEVFQPASHPGWDGPSEDICKAFGEAWVKERRSAIFLVPSIPARLDQNVLINLSHADAARITHGLAIPVPWDRRLFTTPSSS